MSDIYTHIWILLCSFPRESLLPLNLEFFAWHIYCIYIYEYMYRHIHIYRSFSFFFFFIHQNILRMSSKTQRTLLDHPTSSSSEVFAVCGVDDTAGRALEVTVRPATGRRRNVLVSVQQTHEGRTTLTAIYIVLTLEGMNYTSGIQSPFHHTPRHPRGGIRLHSMRVYTLPEAGESCYMHIAKPWQMCQRRHRDLLTQPSVTTLFLSSHSSPLGTCTIPSPQ